jgi:hypothetical protein
MTSNPSALFVGAGRGKVYAVLDRDDDRRKPSWPMADHAE